MAYRFFFSYARADWDAYLERFFNELVREVQDATKVTAGTVGFLDRRDIGTGYDWDKTLSEAASTSLGLVTVCSPSYIASEYCGKELQVFLQRFKPQGGKASAIFPVLWALPSASIHDAYKHLQYTDAALPELYPVEGLRYLARLSKHADDFNAFVTKFARKLAFATTNYPLAPIGVMPAFDQVSNPFARAAARSRGGGTPNARFVYVAASPGEFQHPRTSVDRYGGGGKEWRPYDPQDPKPIGVVAAEVAARHSVFYNELPPDPNLIARLQQAEQDREIVVILVDAWTVQIQTYRDLMRQYDKINFDNCGVLIAWNAPDDETDAHRKTLEKTLEKTFQFKGGKKRGVYYRDSIQSAKALRAALATTLSRLKVKLIAAQDPETGIDAPELEQSAADKGYGLNRTPGVSNTNG